MRFFKDVSRAISAAFRLLAGPNPQTMQAHGRRQPISVADDNPVTKRRKVLADLKVAKRAERVWIAEEGDDTEGGFGKTEFAPR